MTILQKSIGLWIGGAALGLLVGAFTGKPLATMALGAFLVGGIGDGVLEQQRDTGKFSLLPLSWTR